MRVTPALAGVALLAAFSAPAATADPIDESCPTGHVALTFDDGPSSFRPQTLQILRDSLVPATFLDVGTRIEANPHITRFQIREGHTVLNHTYRHDNLGELPAEDVRFEVLANEVALERAGIQMPFKGLRAPYGGGNETSRQVIRDLGYVNVGAHAGGMDFIKGTPPQVIAQLILNALKPGAIILMHDGPIDTASGESVVAALPEIIAGTRERGYCFGGVDAKVAVVPRKLRPAREAIPAITTSAVPYKPYQPSQTLLPPPEPAETPEGLPPRYLTVALNDAVTANQVRPSLVRALERHVDAAVRAYLRADVDNQRSELEVLREAVQRASPADLNSAARDSLLALTNRLLTSLDGG